MFFFFFFLGTIGKNQHKIIGILVVFVAVKRWEMCHSGFSLLAPLRQPPAGRKGHEKGHFVFQSRDFLDVTYFGCCCRHTLLAIVFTCPTGN